MVISQQPKLRDSSTLKHVHVMKQMNCAVVHLLHLHWVASGVKVFPVFSVH